MIVRIDFNTDLIPILEHSMNTCRVSKRLHYALDTITTAAYREIRIKENTNRSRNCILATFNDEQLRVLEDMIEEAMNNDETSETREMSDEPSIKCDEPSIKQ